MRLGGVIFLHDIAQNRRMAVGQTRTNFDIFRTLCGEKAEAALILGTTKWGDVAADVGKRREEELTIAYRKELIIGGSKVHRFEDSGESAWKMVNDILARLETTDPASIGNSESLVTCGCMTQERSLAEADDLAAPRIAAPSNMPTNRATVQQFGDVLAEFVENSISLHDAPIDWLRANIDYISNAVDDMPDFPGSEIAPLTVLLYPVSDTVIFIYVLQK
jgi:hypothetical protein